MKLLSVNTPCSYHLGMSRSIPPFGLRMPPELHEKVKSAAEESGRSMNTEIIARLEASFPSVEDQIRAARKAELTTIRKQIKSLVESIHSGTFDGYSERTLRIKLALFRRMEFDTQMFINEMDRPVSDSEIDHLGQEFELKEFPPPKDAKTKERKR